MNEIVHVIAARMSGGFSAEHGIVKPKRDLLAKAKDLAALDVMRRIEAALDPDGPMNPRKMLYSALRGSRLAARACKSSRARAISMGR